MQRTATSFIRPADVIRKKSRLVFKHGSSSSGQCAQKCAGIFSYISWSSKSYCFSIEVIAPHISLDHHRHRNTATKKDSQRPILCHNCRTQLCLIHMSPNFSVFLLNFVIYLFSVTAVCNKFFQQFWGEKKEE